MKSIFVSSTFRDMNFERDILNRRITPKINHKLREYNQSVSIVDLRWGVDTSDMEEKDASERVLSVCMEAIDNCKPYFVVLIGDRYGYIPAGSDISVTHMEILRGALERVEQEHIYIYFRHADYENMPEAFKAVYIEKNAVSREQLKKLADALRLEMPGRCRDYTARWDAEAQCLVSEDFERILLRDLETDLVEDTRNICYQSELHRQLSENEQVLAENSRFAHCDSGRLDAEIHGILRADRPWVLIGTAGAGKSVYMSLLCSALLDAGHRAQILFCGDNAFSASARNAAEMALHALLTAAGKEYDYQKYSTMSYAELISQIMKAREQVTRKVYLLLDAVDKCDRGMMDFVFWCGSFLTDQAQVVISSRETQEIADRKESLRLSRLDYTAEDYRMMAQHILDKNAKQLNPDCIALALTKIQTPLQLQLLLMRLMRLDAKDFASIQQSGGGMERINAYLKKVIEDSPTETEGLVAAYLKELLGDGERPAFCMYLLSLLAFCEYGLQEDDLRALFELANQRWTELEYVDFLERYAFFIRIRENGRLDLSHDIIRKTLRGLFRKSGQVVCYLLTTHLLRREYQDSMSIRSFLDAAYIGKQQKQVVKFAKKNKDRLHSLEDNELGAEIRRGVRSLFFRDRGEFLLSTAANCGGVDELSAFYMMLSSSLLTMDDYHEEDAIVRIAYVVAAVGIPLLKILGEDMVRMEIGKLHKFLQSNNVRQKKQRHSCAFAKRNPLAGRRKTSRRNRKILSKRCWKSCTIRKARRKRSYGWSFLRLPDRWWMTHSGR